MQLDVRLQTVADLVPKAGCVADIGTDHAYLPVALLKCGKAERAVAGDKNSGPCQAARKTIGSEGLEAKIVVREGDGLAVLEPGEAEVICLCGMGGLLMINILAANLATAKSAKYLILQPMTDVFELRTWLYEHGWQLEEEKLAADKKHIYVIMRAALGSAVKPKDSLLYIGPRLYAAKDPLLQMYMDKQLAQLETAKEGMEKGDLTKLAEQYKLTAKKIAWLKEMYLW